MKITSIVIIALFLFQLCVFHPSSGDPLTFRQELLLPPITEDMVYQPVDIGIRFSHPCWGINEETHSIRVFYSDGTREWELDSQVYNLSFRDDLYIASCNLVFLLQGAGTYYVSYDEGPRSPPGYQDHVSVSDATYYYEPIPGYFVDLQYYCITEDGHCLYGIGQEGTFLGIDMSQKVVQQLPGSTEFDVGNWGQLASYAMFWYEDRDRGTDEKMISKQILIDGNLMAQVGIVSTSREEKVTTTAIYTYYYSPGDEKRLFTKVRHNVVQELHVNEMVEEDGMYAYLLTVKGRSASISNLNLGFIPPYLHVNSENGVQEYLLNQNPESTTYQWVLSTTDDVDLGVPPWFSIDEGEQGRAYALVFDRNNNVTHGEQDGIQVKAVERQEIGVPGLEIDGGGISGGRNSYESGGAHFLTVPQGFTAEFIVEFFSSPAGGVKSVENEAHLFHLLLPYRMDSQENIRKGEKKEGYSVTVFAHLAPSIPFSSMLAVATGHRFPTITAELWSQDTFISSGVCSRISFSPSSPPETIRDIISSMDWRNFSFIKKVTFPHIPPGEYVIKIYREGRSRSFIGATSASINDDTAVHVVCKRNGKIQVTLYDQHHHGVEGARVVVTKENAIISVNNTDASGQSTLLAPSPSTYTLQVTYREYTALNEAVFLTAPLTMKKTAHIDLFTVSMEIWDTLGLSPGISLAPSLKRKENPEAMLIMWDEHSTGHYTLHGIPPGEYLVFVKYKSFTYEETCRIPDTLSYEIHFPAEYALSIKTYTSRGTALSGSVSVKRDGAVITNSEGHTSTFLLPPASYEVTVSSNGQVVGTRSVALTESAHLDITTTKKSALFSLFSVLCIASVVLLSLLFFLKKLSLSSFVLLIVIPLLALSLLSPWWYFHGRGNGALTTTLFLVPKKMITVGHIGATINGESAALPSSFELMLTIVLSLIIMALLLLVLSFFTKKIVFPFSLILTLGAIVLFSYGMHVFSSITTGSLFGSGNLFVSIPGASETRMQSVWLPGSGYFLAITSAIILLVFFLFTYDIRRLTQWRKNK